MLVRLTASIALQEVRTLASLATSAQTFEIVVTEIVMNFLSQQADIWMSTFATTATESSVNTVFIQLALDLLMTFDFGFHCIWDIRVL